MSPDASHGKFLVPGHSELADDEDIQLRVERLGHLERHRYAASRKRQDDYVATATIPLQV